ncbi:sensor histidine kinase [Kytococcus sedentarius]|uniref:sensor histidine kinase n=1 Tax=Kytococcus sedentarius TaxID=1276 RepID=UPI0035BC55EA
MTTRERGRPSVRRLAERGLVGSFILARLVLLVQVAMVAEDGVDDAVHRANYLLALTAVFGVSLLLLAALLHPRGRWAASPLVVADLCAAVALLALLPRALPPDEVVGTWENWAPAYVLNALSGAWVLLPWSAGVVAGFVVAALYLMVGVQDPSVGRGTVWANAATYPGLGVVATSFFHYLRRVASEADAARAEAVEATRLLERERYRESVHDTTSILAQLASPSTPPEVQESLKRQALQESNRLRAWVDTGGPADFGELPTLRGVLEEACLGFEDLRVVRNTDLASDVVVDAGTAEALGAAVRTLLHNVRQHAGAQQTVVHADCLADRWEVVVRDDGRGFDPAAAQLGFGLGVQVREGLRRVGARAEIDAEPGGGTAVTITGRVS